MVSLLQSAPVGALFCGCGGMADAAALKAAEDALVWVQIPLSTGPSLLNAQTGQDEKK